MITTMELQSLNHKSLTAMARDFEIAGRSTMTKDALIAAIRQAQEASREPQASGEQGESKKPVRGKGQAAVAAATAGEGASEPKKSAPMRGKDAAARAQAASRAPAGSKPRAGGSKSGGKTTRGLDGPEPEAASSVRSVKSSSGRSKPATAPKNGGSASKTRSTTRAASPAKRSASKAKAAAAPVSAKSRRIREEMRRRSQQALQNKDLSTGILVAGSALRGSESNEYVPHKDRVVLIVRDAYWLQADWEITRAAVERVRVAMNEKWHTAQPVLRLMAVGDAGSNRAEQLLRDIPIHGGVNTWFIDVENPPARFRVVVGYLSEAGRFYPLCRSNIVETPKADAVHRLDRQWSDIAEDYERIYSLSGGYDVNCSGDLKALFEERLQRQMPNHKDDGLGSDTDAALDRHRALPFEVDAEMIIYGTTTPGATVLLSGEPVKLRADGTFTVRVALPDKRQVLPVIAQSRDGMKQRTTVIAIERNTKVMEAVDRDQNF